MSYGTSNEQTSIVTRGSPDPPWTAAPGNTRGPADEQIRTAVLLAAGLGIPGLFHPGLDETGMGAIWLTMVTSIAKRSGAEISPATAGKFVTSALSSVAAYSLGSKILTWAALPVLAAFPVAGIPAAIGMNAALNALFTFRLGKECVKRFSDPRFTSSDVITLGRLLVSIPSTSEIRDLKRLISGD
jgi:uncharacterized protein (DUF697 family)